MSHDQTPIGIDEQPPAGERDAQRMQPQPAPYRESESVDLAVAYAVEHPDQVDHALRGIHRKLGPEAAKAAWQRVERGLAEAGKPPLDMP